MKRRGFLAAGLAIAGAGGSPASAQRVPTPDIRPMIAAITGGIAPEAGGIGVDLPQLAENGNSVPLRVRVPSPMSAEDHVLAIHILAERNPRARVATFHFTPASGRAEVATRLRLAGTQAVTVVAELSGKRFRLSRTEVLVTAAACLDESL
jgi:sulfur-oxidizing protein SoxY